MRGDRLAAVRVESDSLGKVEVAAERLWGAQTQRSLVNFEIGVERFRWGRPVVRALGVLKKAAAQAQPVILEPIMAVEVTTPEDYMGDVIGDLNSRRGQIQAMEERGGSRVVKAHVPLSEMFGYVGDLRSKTQGRANYSMVFDSYAEVPANVSKEIIAKATGQ